MNPTTSLSFALDEHRNLCSDLKFSVFMGCLPMFRNEFGITVNEKPPIPISFYGLNKLQTANLLSVSRDSLKTMDKDYEYDCLRRMFAYVNKIRVPDEVVTFEEVLKVRAQLKQEQETIEANSRRKQSHANVKRKKSSKITALQDESKMQAEVAGDSEALSGECCLRYDIIGKTVWCEKPAKLYSAKLLTAAVETLNEDGYEVLDYPDEYPGPLDLTNFIEQQSLEVTLKTESSNRELKRIYDRYVDKSRQSNSKNFKRDGDQPRRADDMNVVPLPLVVQPYEIDLGAINLNGFAEKVVSFYFNGTRLAALLRTEAFVPDFKTSFLQKAKRGSYRTIDHDLVCEDPLFIYENRHQRQSDPVNYNEMPKVRRCHSFDLTQSKIHLREIPNPSTDWKNINRTYNDIMSSKLKEKKSPFVLSEIHQLAPEDTKIFEFQITFSPSSEFYEPCDFDELIFLDVS